MNETVYDYYQLNITLMSADINVTCTEGILSTVEINRETPQLDSRRIQSRIV